MYCEKCGKLNPDEAKFCDSCGNPLATPEEVAAPVAPEAPAYDAAPGVEAPVAPEAYAYDPAAVGMETPAPSKNIAKIILPIAIGATAFILTIILIICFKGGPEDPLKNMVKALNTGKAEYMYKCNPDKILEILEEDADYEDNFEDVEELLEDRKEYYEDEYGKGKFVLEIKDKDRVSKSELDDLEDDVNDALEYRADLYDENIKSVKVTDAYEIEYEIRYEGEDGDTEVEDSETTVYKIDGKWCRL